MAGFEVIVRPVVFPSIRPQPARALPPEDDPEQGIATISGSGGQVIDLTYSYNVNKSRSPHRQEVARASDDHRIYQKEGGGSAAASLSASTRSGTVSALANGGEINRDNYVDVRRPHHILIRESDGEKIEYAYARQKPADNIETLRVDVVEYKDTD